MFVSASSQIDVHASAGDLRRGGATRKQVNCSCGRQSAPRGAPTRRGTPGGTGLIQVILPLAWRSSDAFVLLLLSD